MKTVTIPTSQSPFVVMVNGAKYVYPAGSVQDVPDEVAVVIEAHNKQTAKPNEPVEAPFDCDCGGGGGVQSDWNQNDSSAADFIKNKPFGKFVGDTLSWNFNIADIDFDNLPAGMFVKVSNDIVTSSDLTDGLLIYAFGEEMYCPFEEMMNVAEGVIAHPEFLIAFVSESGVGADLSGVSFPEIGVYVMVEMTNGYITIPGFESFISLKKIDPEYLPDIFVSQTVLYMGSDMVYLYKDEGCTEKLTALELEYLIRAKRRVVITDNAIIHLYDAISLCSSDYGIVCFAYLNSETQQLELRTCYTAEYTAS